MASSSFFFFLSYELEIASGLGSVFLYYVSLRIQVLLYLVVVSNRHFIDNAFEMLPTLILFRTYLF